MNTAERTPSVESGDTVRVDFRVPEVNLGRLLDRLETLRKRAVKLHVAPIRFSSRPDGEEIIRRELGFDYVMPMHAVHVEGEAPKLAGWTFLASIDWTDEDLAVMRTVPGESLPESYRQATRTCDHCHLDRQRNTVYVLQSTDGTYKQVGSTCLGDFLGHANPAGLAAMAEFLAMAEEAGEEAEEWSGERGDGARDYLPAYLAWVAGAIRHYGWLSRRQADAEGGEPTSLAAARHMDPSPAELARWRRDGDAWQPTAEDDAAAVAAIEWGRALRESGVTLNDYEYNLTTVLHGDSLDPRNRGLAASAIMAHRRATEREIRRQSERETSHHVGNEGQRLVLDLRLTLIREMAGGQWGPSTLYRFIEGAGNVVTWFASGAGHTDGQGQPLQQGQVYRLKGTVKRHEVYQGVAQTMLTRCQVLGRAA